MAAEKKVKKFWYVVKSDVVDEAMIARDVFDMLRYDGANVECNAPAGFWLLSKEYAYGRPSEERWQRFGARIYIVSIGTEAPGSDQIRETVEIEDKRISDIPARK